MPERKIMTDALAQMDAAIEHIDGLVVEVKKLQDSRRRFKIIVGVLVVGLIAVAGTFAYALDAASDSRRADRNLAAAAALDSCRNGNGATRVTRMFAETQFAIFEVATEAGDPTAQQLALLEELRDAVPKASEIEFDCNGDDVVDDVDYP